MYDKNGIVACVLSTLYLFACGRGHHKTDMAGCEGGWLTLNQVVGLGGLSVSGDAIVEKPPI